MTNHLQKRLDKYPKRVYNLRIGCEGFPYIGDYYKDRSKVVYSSIDLDHEGLPSNIIRQQMDTYAQKVKEVWYEGGFDKVFPNEPVFAGGCIRDMCMVNYANDIDLFVNTYGMDEAEAEDSLALFCYKLGWNFNEHNLDGSAYANQRGESETEFKKSQFVIFNVGLGRADVEVGQLNGAQNIRLQVIGRDCGPPENLSHALDFTADFDYNMVRAAMTIDGEIHLSPEFQLGYEEKTLIIYEPSGHARASDRMPYNFVKETIDLTKPPMDAKTIRDEKLKEREQNLAKVQPTMPFRHMQLF